MSMLDILKKVIAKREPDRLQKCILFSPNIRELCQWDHVLGRTYEESFHMGRKADQIRLDCIMNDGYLQIKKFYSRRDGLEFDSGMDLRVFT